MSNYFNPEDVITKDGVVSNITRNGAGFISTKEGDDVFVPIRLVQTSGIEMGDSVTVYMVKNFGDSSLKNISDSASYRALRVVINNRLGMTSAQAIAATVVLPTYSALPVEPTFLDSVSNPFREIVTAMKPKLTSAVIRQAVDARLEGGFIGTSAMMHGELVKHLPDYDLLGDDAGLRVKMDISSLLHRLHDEGLIAQARICTSGDQKNSSYTVYGPTAKGLFHAIIGA
jgi:cold shock CspA family protein